NPTAVSKWFDILEEEVVKKGVLPGQIYTMDKTGFSPTNDTVKQVIRARGKKIQHKSGGGNQENITTIVTICTDGTYTKPVTIFKGHSVWSKWTENNIANVRFTSSPNGWTDCEIVLDWFTNHFEPETREKAHGHTQVLIVDSHNSHYSFELLEVAVQHNVVLLGYPPHCTHAL
ncbi:uncharacterized protein FOMMEDRAFT_85815, partial [Fomitiporia mediterranea MF3/22]|uniref:uncharacterized protein n=1 Tax=Fomitiporia mediterranea (strain MF3/22) TaxID=694068 RepID=UPI0004408393